MWVVSVGSLGVGSRAAPFSLSEGPQGAAAGFSPLQAGGIVPGGKNDQQGLLCQSDGGATHWHGGKGQCFLPVFGIRVRRHEVIQAAVMSHWPGRHHRTRL